MKRWISFTLLLVISFIPKTFACYFYPYGEDIRFSVFNPQNFKYDRFWMYNYSYNYYYPGEGDVMISNCTENEAEWLKHCKNKVALTEIKKAIFEIGIEACGSKSENRFIQYLYKNKDYETLDYLKFAKEVEKIAVVGSNELWEKDNAKREKLTQIKIEFAKKQLQKIKNTIIKKRYYYQIFKLLDYSSNSNKETIALYDEYINKFKTQYFIDNWALYYRMNAEENDVKTNFLAAQVFARGTDNRFNIQWHFNKNIPIEQVLKFAKTDKERANVYVLYSFRNLEPNLKTIQKVIEVDQSNIALSFLLLREVNKIEDWVLTPTYTMFLPTLRPDYWENSNATRLLNRVEIDRQYAKRLLNVVNKLNFDKVENKHFCLLVKSYLEFLTKDYLKSISTIETFENKVEDKNLKRQIEIVKAMSLTANQTINKAIILEEVKPIILRESENKNYSFLFALAKELEFLNNKVDAGYLISKITIKEGDDYLYSSKFWKSRAGKITLHDDYYDNWYTYIDAELGTADMQKMVDELNIKSNFFDNWKKSTLKDYPDRVYDLLGIKYMREDRLELAYLNFSKVKESHYTNLLFTENPFYKIKGYMNYDPKQNKKYFTKDKVVLQLMKYLKQAKNKQNPKRDIYYFLAANCYYNMTYYGNAWMLKRVSWSTNEREVRLEDEKEYFTCSQAKDLYVKALKYTQNEKFKALCSYMIVKCEARTNEYEYRRGITYFWDYDYNVIEDLNEKSFSNFKLKYATEYKDMMSNCETFTNYYRSRIRSVQLP